MELENKNVVVTGGANGIGKALAQEFHERGARLVLADRDANLLNELVDNLNNKRVNSAHGVVCDLSTEAANAELVSKSKQFLGFIDLFFANAGVAMGTDMSTDEETWNISFDVNVHAHRWAAKYLMPEWLAAGKGYFAVTASAAGVLAQIDGELLGELPMTFTIAEHTVEMIVP